MTGNGYLNVIHDVIPSFIIVLWEIGDAAIVSRPTRTRAM